MRQVKTLGLLGTGVIGGGWAARALHFGVDVIAADVKPEMEGWIRGAVQNAEAALSRLTIAPLPAKGKLTFTTDLLAMARQIKQLIGANRDFVEPIQKTDACQFADRVRQRVDTDSELTDRIRLLIKLAINAARPQHERGGETADTAADDDRFHGLNSTQPRMQPDCR